MFLLDKTESQKPAPCAPLKGSNMADDNEFILLNVKNFLK